MAGPCLAAHRQQPPPPGEGEGAVGGGGGGDGALVCENSHDGHHRSGRRRAPWRRASSSSSLSPSAAALAPRSTPPLCREDAAAAALFDCRPRSISRPPQHSPGDADSAVRPQRPSNSKHLHRLASHPRKTRMLLSPTSRLPPFSSPPQFTRRRFIPLVVVPLAASLALLPFVNSVHGAICCFSTQVQATNYPFQMHWVNVTANDGVTASDVAVSVVITFPAGTSMTTISGFSNSCAQDPTSQAWTCTTLRNDFPVLYGTAPYLPSSVTLAGNQCSGDATCTVAAVSTNTVTTTSAGSTGGAASGPSVSSPSASQTGLQTVPTTSSPASTSNSSSSFPLWTLAFVAAFIVGLVAGIVVIQRRRKMMYGGSKTVDSEGGSESEMPTLSHSASPGILPNQLNRSTSRARTSQDKRESLDRAHRRRAAAFSPESASTPPPGGPSPSPGQFTPGSLLEEATVLESERSGSLPRNVGSRGAEPFEARAGSLDRNEGGSKSNSLSRKARSGAPTTAASHPSGPATDTDDGGESNHPLLIQQQRSLDRNKKSGAAAASAPEAELGSGFMFPDDSGSADPDYRAPPKQTIDGLPRRKTSNPSTPTPGSLDRPKRSTVKSPLARSPIPGAAHEDSDPDKAADGSFLQSPHHRLPTTASTAPLVSFTSIPASAHLTNAANTAPLSSSPRKGTALPGKPLLDFSAPNAASSGSSQPTSTGASGMKPLLSFDSSASKQVNSLGRPKVGRTDTVDASAATLVRSPPNSSSKSTAYPTAEPSSSVPRAALPPSGVPVVSLSRPPAAAAPAALLPTAAALPQQSTHNIPLLNIPPSTAAQLALLSPHQSILTGTTESSSDAPTSATSDSTESSGSDYDDDDDEDVDGVPDVLSAVAGPEGAVAAAMSAVPVEGRAAPETSNEAIARVLAARQAAAAAEAARKGRAKKKRTGGGGGGGATVTSSTSSRRPLVPTPAAASQAPAAGVSRVLGGASGSGSGGVTRSTSQKQRQRAAAKASGKAEDDDDDDDAPLASVALAALQSTLAAKK